MKGDKAICVYCGKEFIKNTYNHKYCSNKCYVTKHLVDRESADAPRMAVFVRDDMRCCYCGRSPIEDGATLMLEHIIPRIYGGDNSVYNVVTSCGSCNREKQNRLLPEGIYKRILRRNIKRNKGISLEMRNRIKQYLADQYQVSEESLVPLIKQVYNF